MPSDSSNNNFTYRSIGPLLQPSNPIWLLGLHFLLKKENKIKIYNKQLYNSFFLASEWIKLIDWIRRKTRTWNRQLYSKYCKTSYFISLIENEVLRYELSGYGNQWFLPEFIAVQIEISVYPCICIRFVFDWAAPQTTRW